MCLQKIFGKFAKRLKWYDISLVKLAVLFFTLFLLTALPGLRAFALGIPWYAHLALAVLFSLLAMRKLCAKK